MNETSLRNELSFKPIVAGGNAPSSSGIIAGGVGGSALAARAFFFLDPAFPIWLHDDYGLPEKSDEGTLFVPISYSGNTLEVLSFASEALKEGHPTAIITSGGKLLDFAKENNLPYILIEGGLLPREASISMLRALLFLAGRTDLLNELENTPIRFDAWAKEGEKAGSSFLDKVPLIYASRRNEVLSYVWKIMFNETGKIPAFSNHFPELAHNEMQGIVPETAGELAGSFKALLLLDDEDSKEVRRTMSLFIKKASEAGIEADSTSLEAGRVGKLISTWVMAEHAARHVAERHGVSADGVPFIESFKKEL